MAVGVEDREALAAGKDTWARAAGPGLDMSSVMTQVGARPVCVVNGLYIPSCKSVKFSATGMISKQLPVYVCGSNAPEFST